MNPFKAWRDMRAIASLLTDAERIAREMGDEEPHAEHLAIAAVGLPDGSAARALERLGLRAAALKDAVVGEQAAGLVAAGLPADAAAELAWPRPLEQGAHGVYRSSPSARELFQAAGAMARGARQPFRGAHVLLAAADLQHGTLARSLRRLDVDPDRLRAAARAELA